MGFFAFLHRRFGSLEKTEEDENLQVEEALNHWRDYVGTVAEKLRIIKTVPINPERLQTVLRTELEDLEDDLDDEEALFVDVKRISEEYEAEKLQMLSERLNDNSSEARYLFMLFEALIDIVHSETRLVRRLIKGARDWNGIVSHLEKHIGMELDHVKRVQAVMRADRIYTKQKLFHSLMRGGKVVRRLNAEERRIRHELETYERELPKSVTQQWVDLALEEFAAAVDEASRRMEVSQTIYDRLQFVNSDHLLSEFAMDTLRKIRKENYPEGLNMHSPLIKAFVSSFRDAYNRANLFEEQP